MTFEQRAELIADFVEATRNKYSRLHYDKRLFEALKAYNDTYEERRVHGFSEAQREANIAAIAILLMQESVVRRDRDLSISIPKGSGVKARWH